MPIILFTQVVEIGKREVTGQPGKSSWDLFSTNKLDVVAHACHLSYMGGRNRRMEVQAGQSKKYETLIKK
jgi:hypothetical protein